MAQYKGAASEAGRAMQIMKRREKEQEEMEQKKRKLEETLKINKIENKFAVHYDAIEQQLKVRIRDCIICSYMKVGLWYKYIKIQVVNKYQLYGINIGYF